MRIITCDFDDTLAANVQTAWGGLTLFPISRVIQFVQHKISEGAEVHIVSFRQPAHRREIVEFCLNHSIQFKSIVCTGGMDKTPHLTRLGSTLHIDDCVETCTLAVMAGIPVLLVDMGQEETNCMAREFPKL